MSAHLSACLKFSKARETDYMLNLIDATGSIVRDMTAGSGSQSTPLLAGDTASTSGRVHPSREKGQFLAENFVLATSALQKADGQLFDVISSLEDDFKALLPMVIQEHDVACAGYISRMSDENCRKALLTSNKLTRHHRRSAKSQETTIKMYKVQLNHYTQEHADWRTFAHGQAEQLDRLEYGLKKAQKELQEKQEELHEKQKDASALSDQINKLASRLQELAGSSAAKKNDRTPFMSRLKSSLANLKQKLESLDSSNVSQKDLEAREKEIDALKAENAKLLENVRDAQADRQRALEDNERLREQIQKLRAEKHADGSGKKKKSK